MSELNELLKNEAVAHGFLSWKEFKKFDPDNAKQVRMEILRNEREVGLW